MAFCTTVRRALASIKKSPLDPRKAHLVAAQQRDSTGRDQRRRNVGVEMFLENFSNVFPHQFWPDGPNRNLGRHLPIL
jgi:hypothetical protein